MFVLGFPFNHRTNPQGREELDDGRTLPGTLPELEFWQMDVHIEWFDLNGNTITGILGESMYPVLDKAGHAIMSGADALRGEVKDYRISDPLVSLVPRFH